MTDGRREAREIGGGEPWQQPSFDLSEQNLAECFADKHGAEFCYTQARKTWRRYDGARWIDDALLQLCAQLQRFLKRVAQYVRKTKDRLLIGSSRVLSAVEKLLRSILWVDEDVFDRDPWLLNCPGGTLDLRTGGRMREHRREDYITKITAADPGGECPQWFEFIEFITCSNGRDDAGHELAGYLQRLAGYALTGDASEEMFAFLYGGGANGKTVFVGTLLHVLGDYGVTCPSNVFTAKPFEQHPEELMTLRGARLIISSEVAANAKWNEQRIKMVTGGERVRARLMRENSVEFESTGTLIISGNHKPDLHAVDEAIKRRMHLVPFNAKVDEDKRDKHLGKRLLAQEAGGILQWMIHGCHQWQAEGIVRPQPVKDATDEYIRDQDVIEQWIDERCNDGRKHSGDTTSEKVSVLYSSWRAWAEQNGVSPGSINPFSTRLSTIGFERFTNGRERRFKRITLRYEERPDDRNEPYYRPGDLYAPRTH